MNDMVLFLASKPRIKEVVLVCGIDSSANLFADICRVMPIDYMSVYFPLESMRQSYNDVLERLRVESKSFLPKEIRFIEKNELRDYQAKTKSFALVFDALQSNQEILSLCHLNPEFLVGTLHKDAMNAFGIWETYRTVTEEIYLLSWKHHNEVLYWKKNNTSDIELSVVFPMYNVAKYLPKCIETVTKWNADYVEFLFVDDGSPDNCAEVVGEYAKKDSRIHLLRKENGGCASARQYGLERAKGTYVGFIDPDDYIDPTMYRKLLARAMEGSYEISYCGYKELYEITGEIQEIPDVLGWPYNEGTDDPVKINELIAYRKIAIWRGIYSRDLIERSGIHFYTDIRRFDDLPFKVETFCKARSVVCVPEYLYYYRMARPGQDVSADDERLYVHFQIFKYLDDFIAKSNDRTQTDYLQVVKIQTHRWALEKIKPEYVKDYCKQAKVDMEHNFSFTDSVRILRKMATKQDLAYYVAIHNSMYGLVNVLKKPRKQRKSENEVAIQKLAKL